MDKKKNIGFSIRIDDIHIHDGESLELVYTIVLPEALSSKQTHTGFAEFPLPTGEELSKLQDTTLSSSAAFVDEASESARHESVLCLIRKHSALKLNEEMPGRFQL